MKSERQERAEELASRFHSTGRKPIVLEFAGVPKAGKTTTLGQVQAFLKRCGFRADTVVERASVCPILDKKHANFNVWTACTTLAQLLEKTQTPPRAGDPEILILDRGVFDSLCWLTLMQRLSRLRDEDLAVMESFLCIDDWRERLSAVFVMVASPEDSLGREKGHLPVEGASGSIMNREVLQKSVETTREVCDRLGDKFRIHIIDTSSNGFRDNARATSEAVADLVLDIIEEELLEKILFAPVGDILSVFNDSTSVRGAGALRVLDCFAHEGKFAPRDVVENDASVIQALPVVVVRNASGDVLRLRRNETNESSPLHKQLVIWAGGHVRVEDGTNGTAIVHGAVRELEEELRLSVEPDELQLLGSVYVPTSGERTSKHVAVVYQWNARTDDVAVALSNAEFFERRGNSLSGKFVPVSRLVEDALAGNIQEMWSVEILREFLAPAPEAFPPRLF